MQSAERVSHQDVSDNYVFQRSQLAYHRAAEIVSGDVLEIGTGSGYGISIVAPKTDSFITIDKHENSINTASYDNVEFHCMNVPPLTGIHSNSFDFVICFQVIEHIKNDFGLIKEVYRVLRPGGKFIVSTPNKDMSLTRNPWHVREYTVDEFKNLMSSYFNHVSAKGVFGRDKVMTYYAKNKKSVEAIRRFDLFGFEKRLPRWLLRIPYDLLNRINRRKLLIDNRNLTSTISMEDYYFDTAGKECFDLYFIAEK